MWMRAILPEKGVISGVCAQKEMGKIKRNRREEGKRSNEIYRGKVSIHYTYFPQCYYMNLSSLISKNH